MCVCVCVFECSVLVSLHMWVIFFLLFLVILHNTHNGWTPEMAIRFFKNVYLCRKRKIILQAMERYAIFEKTFYALYKT